MQESNAPERLFAPVFRAMLLRVSILVAPLCAFAIWAVFADEKRKPGDATEVFGGIGILYVLCVSEITIITRRLIQIQRRTLEAEASAPDPAIQSPSSHPASIEPQLPPQHFSSRRFPWMAVGGAAIFAIACGGLLVFVLNRSTPEPRKTATLPETASQSKERQQEPARISAEKPEQLKSLESEPISATEGDRKKRAQAKPDPMPTWALPIRIGENRESVYRTLGEPSLDIGKRAAKEWRTPQFKMQREEGKLVAWRKRGLNVEFVDNRVARITVELKPSTKGDDHYDAYAGGLFLGIKSGDDLQAFTTKLGPEDSSVAEVFFDWEIPSIFIQVAHDDSFGFSVSIRDLKSYLNEEAAHKQAPKFDASAYEQEQKLVALSGEILTPKEIFRRYAPRVVEIHALNSRGQASSQGTGFAWKQREIITNRHVIAQARALKVKWSARALEFNNSLSNKEQDWAVLAPPDDESMKTLPPVGVAKTLPEVGDAVIVIGNPKGLTNSLSTGIVAGLRRMESGIWIQITAPISAGSSESPVFDERGYLLGLATMRLMDGENLNFVTPVHQIVEGRKRSVSLKDELQVAWQERLPLDYYQKGVQRELWKAYKTPAEIQKQLQKLLAEFADPEDQEYIFADAAIRSSILNAVDLRLQILRRKVAQLGATYGDWADIGDCLLDLKHGQEARDAFINAIALAESDKSKEDPVRLLILAECNYQLGKRREAEIWADKLKKQFPDFKDLLNENLRK